MRLDERETGGIDRDILEWNSPEEVLAVLLKDRSTGRNLIWATDDYAERGDGFGAGDEMRIEQIVDKDNPVIRPRVDKSPDEQRQRVVKRAEVFTPTWICNKQNNLVDAAWFGWKKPDSSPFNTELEKFDPATELGWRATCGRQSIKFPKGKTWQEYVKAPRLEVSCGEAPYLASRYDTVSGRVIPIGERIGLLDRKLRVITENIGTVFIRPTAQEWENKVGDGSSTTIASVPTTDAPLSTTDKAGAATNAISAVTDRERVAHLLTAFGELRSDARKSMEIALKELLANASITAEAIAKKSGVSSRTIQRAIMSLVKAGVIKRVGPDKGGHWEVV